MIAVLILSFARQWAIVKPSRMTNTVLRKPVEDEKNLLHKEFLQQQRFILKMFKTVHGQKYTIFEAADFFQSSPR